jgi:TRAP-type C4-dicarboxylate transport system permease small subunit
VGTALGKLHGWLTDAAAAASALCIGVVALAYAGEVIARYFFRAPLNWSGDVGSYLLCACVFLGLPRLTREGAHVAVAFVEDRLGKVARGRYQTALGYVSGIVLIVVALFVAQEGWRQFDQNILTSQATQISKWWLAALACLGFTSSGLHLLFPAARSTTARGASI